MFFENVNLKKNVTLNLRPFDKQLLNSKVSFTNNRFIAKLNVKLILVILKSRNDHLTLFSA